MIQRASLVMVLLLAAGCGYTAGPLTPKGIRTVYVPIFGNETFQRGLEVELTEAVKREVLIRTNLRLADSAETSDSVLEGSIVDFKERVLARDAADVLLTKRVTVVVNFEWRDSRTNRTLASARGLTRPADMLRVREETVATATQESLRDLAELIVRAMERSW